MQVSILAAFVAGLISFLSPCVLPLVPGYVSMLSGIGVEQLRRGEKSRGNLLASSFAFVIGFSVVFVTFGASASAVGQFLLQNKNLLAPFAGAIIVLFGLHLIGLLGRIPVRAGLVVGALLAIGGLAIWMRLGENAPRLFGPAQFISVSLIFLASWIRVRVWLDALHRPNPGWCAGHGCDERDRFARRFHVGRVLRWSGDPIFADRAWDQSVFEFLPAIPPPLARRRGGQRRASARRGLSDFRQPADAAFRQTEFSERLREVRSGGKWTANS